MPADEKLVKDAKQDAAGVILRLQDHLDALFWLRHIFTSASIAGDDLETIRVLLEMVQASARQCIGELEKARISASLE